MKIAVIGHMTVNGVAHHGVFIEASAKECEVMHADIVPDEEPDVSVVRAEPRTECVGSSDKD